ncbi:MAG: MBOAT family protein [Verrucomicrobia bacterium]|nr:MBOAT family protein [Verrucomicrobiota bacterium]MBV9657289.1 MBOAT family protein [Verrucomicrobiota bacterium]
MVFSSVLFLFLFLPGTLGIYYALPRARWLRNVFLLCVSLLFYAWGEAAYVLVMLASIVLNYFVAVLLEDHRGRPAERPLLWFGVAANLALLCYFKYANFLADNLSALWASVFRLLGFGAAPALHLAPVHLPVGISFFTFHALSYLLDIHRGKVAAQRNPLDLGLYISLFPQLVAGPVVRYSDVADQITQPRRVTLDGFAEGVRRFILGLGKKVLLANPLGQAANTIFALDHHTALTGSVAWLGILCYTLQIYFDFSGYSDMAIGLGRLFGFRFLENFNYPYISRSLGEFWRRWHISLSSWFRDYLYIPLGGNRHGRTRTLFNLLAVFFFCGLWHGASWSFVVWGLWHGGFLIGERLVRWETKFAPRLPAILTHGYTLLVVMVGWVFFREESLVGALAYLRVLGGGSAATVQAGLRNDLASLLDPALIFTLVLGAICCMPTLSWLQRWRERIFSAAGAAPSTVWARAWLQNALLLGDSMALLAVFAASVLSLASGVYNPFIYFRF